MLELGGTSTGFLQSVDGGGVRADVVSEEAPAGNAPAKKHLGRPKYEDLVIEVGMAMSSAFWDWVCAFLDAKAPRRDGTVIAADVDGKRLHAHEISDALITELRVPALDGASKDPGFLRMVVAPDATTVVPGDGGLVSAPHAKKQKLWQTSNFRLRVGDLPCGRVSKIDSFTIKQGVKPSDDDRRQHRLEPTKLEIPNLLVTLSASDLQPWFEWYEEFVVAGKSGDDAELAGEIALLGPDGSTLLELSLHHVGVSSLSLLGAAEGSNAAAGKFTVELYVESMSLSKTPATN
jgi:phage tail-like protein